MALRTRTTLAVLCCSVLLGAVVYRKALESEKADATEVDRLVKMGLAALNEPRKPH